MPNVLASKQEYQNEIGLNLDALPHNPPPFVIAKRPEERFDPCKEARDILPETPFFKIVKKDRIASIEDYYDRWPLLNFRKMLMRWRVYINRGA